MIKITIFTFLVLFIGFNICHGQIILNGMMDDAEFIALAEKQNSNLGFGPACDISSIHYYSDNTTQILYIGVICKLDVTTNNGLGLWLNTTAEPGASAGTALGIPGAGHYIDGNGAANMNYTADFEVDYQFALNPGSSASAVYFDAASNVAGTSQYIGFSDQAGTPALGPASDGVFTTNSISWAFDSARTVTSGWEIAIPYAQLNIDLTDSIQIFTCIVSHDAYFSDVCVPGNITGGNLGYDPDFNTLGISAGPFHTAMAPIKLPASDINFNDIDLPMNTTLFQNYPNPFNPKTTIHYTVGINDYASIQKVNLSIHNMLGQKVATLVSETQKAGSYCVEWNAVGQASGIYIYKLQSGAHIFIKKMVLMK